MTERQSCELSRMAPSRASIISRGVAGAVAPSLAPSAVGMPSHPSRRASLRPRPNDDMDTRDVSTDPKGGGGVVWREGSLGDRASSKLTLDDELFDILYAFGESETIFGKNKDDEEDDGKPVTRQDLLNKIRQKKEVIGKLRCQPWNMGRKRRTLKLAQKYLEQHESKISKSHLYKEELKKSLRLMKRSFYNFKTYLIPWEGKIKRIESHFGSVVSSYFTFLRWIVFVNLMITLIIVCFIVVPEALADAAADSGRQNRTETRKVIPPHEKVHADKLAVVWHFDGYVRYSPLFYGYYSDDEFVGTNVRYALPLAYFIVTLFIFGYSFFAILRKMAQNARMSKLSGSKAEQYIFNWRVFTGWDYTIGNQDTASNTVMAVVIKLRESIAECRVASETKFRCLQFTLRIVANILIFAMLAFSIYCISFAVKKSQTVMEEEGNLFTKNQVPTVVSTITHVFPMIFDLIGKMENYHPRTALRAHLTRVLVLYMLNYLTLIIALFDKLDSETLKREAAHQQRMKRQLGGWNPNIPRPPPYASLQFDSRREFLDYLKEITEKYLPTNSTEQWATSPAARVSKRTTKSTTTPFTVQPQFGPLNVNHPNVLRHNASKSKSFQRWIRQISQPTSKATRVGPEPLPIFTPPPRTFPPHKPGKVKQTFGGPDLPRKFYPTKPPPPRIRTTPPWQKSKPTRPAKTSTKPTKIPNRGGSDRTRTPGSRKNNERKILFETSVEEDSSNYEEPQSSPQKVTPRRGGTGQKPKGGDGQEGDQFDYTDEPKETSDLPIIQPDDSSDNLDENPKDYMSGEKVHIDTSEEAGVVKGDVLERRLLKDGDIADHICWETMIGQEIVKLVTMDLIVTIVSILLIDFLRGLWIKYCSSWWCWDIETTFPEYGEFKVAENVLHIINNQGMIWLGLFFAPLLPALNNIKLIILMYIRGWACMTCNVPAREIFRASRSSNFYLVILLLWLLLCTLPVGFVVASKKPSPGCGPFAKHEGFYTVVTDVIQKRVDSSILAYLRHIASPGVVIPIIIFLVLIIYFLVSLVRGLREANTDLQQQLIHERTEEKKKIFELAGGGQKKKPEIDRDKDRRKVVTQQYIPTVEQKRREPWRQYNGLEHDESLIVSDSDSSESELDESPDMEVPLKAFPPPVPSSTSETVPAMHQFHPSLGSLIENDSEESPPKEPEPIPRSLSASVDKGPVWRESPSNTSFDVHSNVVDMTTPEEIRNLIRPLMEGRYTSSSHSLVKAFPKDIASPPTFVMTGGSRRSSKRSSYISLYEYPKEEGAVPVMIHAPGSTKLTKRDDVPPRVPTHRPSSLLPTAEEQEPKREVKRLPPTAEQPTPPVKFEAGEIKPDFQPWPSIDEVKERRQQLQMRPLALGKPPQSTPIVPKTRTPTEAISQSTPGPSTSQAGDSRRSASPTRRFRISVSPTKNIDVDSDSLGASKRRYVIKQEKQEMGSTSTGLSSTQPKEAPSASQSKEVPPQSLLLGDIQPSRAPLASFGEDDSPRS